MTKRQSTKASLSSPTAPNAGETPHDTVRLQALIASIGEGVIATDEDGQITHINKTALTLLGRTRREMQREPFLSVVHAMHDNGLPVDVFDRPIVKAFQTGKTVSGRSLYKQKDGSLLPVYITVSPVVAEGHPIGAIEVFRDLTNEIQSDKLKSDFISIASHQLRTPLTAINMYTRMLQGGIAGPLTSEQLTYISIILGSVERMNGLIDTLLNITRLEAGSITVQSRPVRIDKLTTDIIVEFMPAAAAKDITLSASIPDRLQPARTDNLLIREICANLISNAIKYTPERGTVHVSLQAKQTEYVWTVTDSGYGIPADAQKNIFAKFFRAENIVSKDVSGTGLGLYLIKNLAESLGGELSFESTEDVGSTFSFCLPRERSR